MSRALRDHSSPGGARSSSRGRTARRRPPRCARTSWCRATASPAGSSAACRATCRPGRRSARRSGDSSDRRPSACAVRGGRGRVRRRLLEQAPQVPRLRRRRARRRRDPDERRAGPHGHLSERGAYEDAFRAFVRALPPRGAPRGGRARGEGAGRSRSEESRAKVVVLRARGGRHGRRDADVARARRRRRTRRATRSSISSRGACRAGATCSASRALTTFGTRSRRSPRAREGFGVDVRGMRCGARDVRRGEAAAGAAR